MCTQVCKQASIAAVYFPSQTAPCSCAETHAFIPSRNEAINATPENRVSLSAFVFANQLPVSKLKRDDKRTLRVLPELEVVIRN